MGGGGSRARSRGYRAERELVTLLWRLGFAVMRAPASGAKIKRADYPDIVAIKNGKVLVFEVKRRSSPSTIYIDPEQYRKLMNFAKRAGGKAYIAIKIPRREWVFIDAEKLTTTSTGRYRVSKEDIENGLTLTQVLEAVGIRIGLEEYLSSDK